MLPKKKKSLPLRVCELNKRARVGALTLSLGGALTLSLGRSPLSVIVSFCFCCTAAVLLTLMSFLLHLLIQACPRKDEHSGCHRSLGARWENVLRFGWILSLNHLGAGRSHILLCVPRTPENGSLLERLLPGGFLNARGSSVTDAWLSESESCLLSLSSQEQAVLPWCLAPPHPESLIYTPDLDPLNILNPNRLHGLGNNREGRIIGAESANQHSQCMVWLWFFPSVLSCGRKSLFLSSRPPFCCH